MKCRQVGKWVQSCQVQTWRLIWYFLTWDVKLWCWTDVCGKKQNYHDLGSVCGLWNRGGLVPWPLLGDKRQKGTNKIHVRLGQQILILYKIHQWRAVIWVNFVANTNNPVSWFERWGKNLLWIAWILLKCCIHTYIVEHVFFPL